MNNNDIVTIVVSVISATLTSSGVWAYIMARKEGKSATSRLLMGLAYDKIIWLGMAYLDKGSITKDEYEDFSKYLYEPYIELGGNGIAKRIMEEVSKLPLSHHVREPITRRNVQHPTTRRPVNVEYFGNTGDE